MTGSAARHRWLALYVLCAGVLMIVLDTTIVNVALPSIREDLRFTETSLVWVVNAYMRLTASTILTRPDITPWRASSAFNSGECVAYSWRSDSSGFSHEFAWAMAVLRICLTFGNAPP